MGPNPNPKEAQWGTDTGITVDNSVVVPLRMPRMRAQHKLRVGGSGVQSRRLAPVRYGHGADDGLSERAATAEEVAEARHLLATCHENYRRLPYIFNHSIPTVDALIQQGLAKDVRKPEISHCTSCMVANERSVSFGAHAQSDLDADIPWSEFQVDVWGRTILVRTKGMYGARYIVPAANRGLVRPPPVPPPACSGS